MNANFDDNPKTPTAPEDNIRFEPAKDGEQKVNQKVSGVKKAKKARRYFLIPLILLMMLSLIFIVWHIIPKKTLNICVLDKTVLSATEDNDINPDSVYRKHQGLFWIINQQRYALEDGSSYDYKKDYFGPIIDENGKLLSERTLSTLDYTPDLLYISDLYGVVDDTYGYYKNSAAKGSGITVDDMSVISYAHENGATVIAEKELFNSGLSDSVYSQLTSLCGVKPTTWVGRYIVDLQDFSDVPDWAPPMYEQQEGVSWQFAGPGLLLVSSDKILVLEQKTDFQSKNLLKISINEEYKKEFGGCNTVNFYNWFEIVEPSSNSEVIANFELDVNATGMEKLKGILSTPSFAAILRKNYEGKSPVYYFAGDFNDYVNHEKYNGFLFANHFYRWISYDINGDISNFFWNFYNPLMTNLLSKIEHIDSGEDNAHKHEAARIYDDSFEVYSKDGWKKTELNAISINAAEAGSSLYSRNYNFYESLVSEMAKLGVNCVNAKDILPPEFYRAIYANNVKVGSAPIYIIQSLTEPADNGKDAWKSKIESAIDALHGNGTVKAQGRLTESSYFIDVSDYLLALRFDCDLSENGDSYSGKYAASADIGYAAFLYDTAQQIAKDGYGCYIPIGISANAAQIKNSGFEGNDSYNFNDIITDKTCRENYFFTSVSLGDVTSLISANESKISDKSDKYAYVFKALGRAADNRLMITDIGFSSANGIYSQKGTTEKAQGQMTVNMLKSADDAQVLCAVVSDLNDDWSALSDNMKAFTVPADNNCMWQNTADPTQTTGVVAMDPAAPEEAGITLSDDDRVQKLSLSANEGYFYITAQLLTEIDYSAEQLFIGIDTYQRNDGEYYYAQNYTPTSLSGMEFVLRFDSKQKAGLYVTSSYNRSKGQYKTKESYKGSFELVSALTYGGFSCGDNQFYQTGSTIYIRIPWSWLNVTDPSQKIVLNNDGAIDGAAKTVSTNGALVSVLIGDKQTKDQLYLFPETKQDPAYKVFKWQTWDKVSYVFREKESFNLLKKYYNSK